LDWLIAADEAAKISAIVYHRDTVQNQSAITIALSNFYVKHGQSLTVYNQIRVLCILLQITIDKMSVSAMV
jgi:hypothetical protein